MAIIAAIATIGGTVASVNQQKKAAKAQQQQQQLQTQRSQRQAIREAQLRRAQTQATASGAGVTGGSALGGGLSSLRSQLGGSLGYSSQMSGLSKNISIASSKAQTAGAIAGLGMQAFTGLGGFGAFGQGGQGPSEADLLKGIG